MPARGLMRRRGISSSVSTEQCISEKAKEILQLLTLKKGPPLTLKQLDYCREACSMNRILGSKNNYNAKKAAKQLRATLTWRANYDVDYLTADEFSAELAAGVAYVAGHDEEGRPVVILTINSEPFTNKAQKQLMSFLAFTLEVAITAMESPVEQCVLIIHAGSFRKGSPPLSMIVQLLKALSDHYPRRIARAFMVDAPSMFYYLWKGISSLLFDLGIKEGLRFVYTRHYTVSTQAAVLAAASHLIRAAKSKQPDKIVTVKNVPSLSQKSLIVCSCNNGADLLTTTTTTTTTDTTLKNPSLSQKPVIVCSCNNGASLLSNQSKARSSSFATSWMKPAITSKESKKDVEFRSFRVQHEKQRGGGDGEEQDQGSRRWSDLSLIDETKKDHDSLHDYHLEHTSTRQKTIDLFRPYYFNFIKGKPYNEAAYRASMKPPLAGLISIISPDLSRIN